MLITDEIFQAFLQCETKSYLKLLGAVGGQRMFSDWERDLVEDYKQQCYRQSCAIFREAECLVGGTFPQGAENSRYRFLMDCRVRAQEMQSHIHAAERLTSRGNPDHSLYIPIRCVPKEKITKQDRLLLAFDALILWTVSGQAPLFGKIIHGHEQATVKMELAGWMDMAKTVIGKIAAQHASHTPPSLILNQYCTACEFQARCRQIALEKNELSLLAHMTPKERQQQHNKGIFSVTQLSYTFRARRKPKHFASKPEKYSHALRALALRERKIYIAGKPELHLKQNPVYLDVEGIPDQDFYYLIGLRFKSGDAYVQHSFWADDVSEEKKILAAFLCTLAEIENPQLIHYGSYETIFLKRMKGRYGESVKNPAFLDQLTTDTVNLLSVIYSQIYFPTYSNGLKDMAKYLGFQWSDSDASGLHTLVWRSKWESSKDFNLKQKLLTYNAEDCEALEKLTRVIAQLCQRPEDATKREDDNIIHIDSLKREDYYYFGNKEFSMPELKYINQAAYWDYQRETIYVRSGSRLRRVSQAKAKYRLKSLPIDKIVEYMPPSCCPQCKATDITKFRRSVRIVYDLKLSKSGVKRWITKYITRRYLCCNCGARFNCPQNPWQIGKYGSGLRSYIVYQIIELYLHFRPIAQSIKELFGLDLGSRGVVNYQKTIASQLYQGTYKGILEKIIKGKLIHADETKISIKGKDAYVWVFTTMEDVVYYYTETREGYFLQELLRGFHGVLVSDFYAAYDSIPCPQQKCLIHLMRDLNDDLLKQPFNEELKGLVRDFAMLLKPMIETIDRFGLKAHFLQKHKVFVECFYEELSTRDYQSEIAVHYKKRFEKNRDKLFTFIDYDGVPWNNNNAEHAIKAFSALRDNIDGISTEKGLSEYLILLSICETCKYKGISFLEFLCSGEKDVDEFIAKGRRVIKG